MRFDCGPTAEERKAAEHVRLTNWHRKFAWFPVRVGPRDCRWLEFIERRGIFNRGGPFSEDYYKWIYRPISK